MAGTSPAMTAWGWLGWLFGDAITNARSPGQSHTAEPRPRSGRLDGEHGDGVAPGERSLGVIARERSDEAIQTKRPR